MKKYEFCVIEEGQNAQIFMKGLEKLGEDGFQFVGTMRLHAHNKVYTDGASVLGKEPILTGFAIFQREKSIKKKVSK